MGIGIGVVAQAPEIVFAEEAVAARNGEGDNDAIPGLQLLYFAAYFFYHSHEFVTENISRLHRGNQTSVEMKIAATDGGPRNLNDCVPWIDDLRVRHFMHFDRFLAHPTDGLH